MRVTNLCSSTSKSVRDWAFGASDQHAHMSPHVKLDLISLGALLHGGDTDESRAMTFLELLSVLDGGAPHGKLDASTTGPPKRSLALAAACHVSSRSLPARYPAPCHKGLRSLQQSDYYL